MRWELSCKKISKLLVLSNTLESLLWISYACESTPANIRIVRKQVNEVLRPRKLVQIRRPSHTALEQCGSGHGELVSAEVQLRAVWEVLEQR